MHLPEDLIKVTYLKGNKEQKLMKVVGRGNKEPCVHTKSENEQ